MSLQASSKAWVSARGVSGSKEAGNIGALTVRLRARMNPTPTAIATDCMHSSDNSSNIVIHRVHDFADRSTSGNAGRLVNRLASPMLEWHPDAMPVQPGCHRRPTCAGLTRQHLIQRLVRPELPDVRRTRDHIARLIVVPIAKAGGRVVGHKPTVEAMAEDGTDHRARCIRAMSPIIATIVRLALLTGLRRTEIAAARKVELDLNSTSPALTIPRGRAKNRNAHRVPLSRQAASLFRQAVEAAGESEFVFPGERSPSHIASRSFPRWV